MIFLRRFKKYVIAKKLASKFYTGTSYIVTINYLLYGNMIGDGDDLEQFTGVSYDDHCNVWCMYDVDIMRDRINFSHKSIHIVEGEIIAECKGCINLVCGWIYNSCPGFYLYINKTLYRYYMRDDSVDILIAKIRK